MPKEIVQQPRVDGSVSTETSVRWTREDQGGHVQISVQRHPWQRPKCPNGCDGVNTGCSECPPAGRLALGGAYQLPPGDFTAPPVHQGGAVDVMAHGDTVTRTLTPEPATNAVELAATQEDGSVVMWTDPLNRDDLNKLIRVLRRARDQAYGPDA